MFGQKWFLSLDGNLSARTGERPSHRLGPWSLVLVPGPGPWSLVPGPWSLVPGPWALVPGPWSLVPGPWSLVLVPGPGPWSLVPGPGPARAHFQDKTAREFLDKTARIS